MEEFLTPDQIAERFKVSRRTVLNWIRSGKLAGRKIGQQWRVSAAALQAFMQEAGPEIPDPASRRAYPFAMTDVVRLTGVNRKTLHYWVQEGFIAPSLAGEYGTRAARLWSFGDVVALRVMQKLRQAGFDLHSVKVVLLLVEYIQRREGLDDIDRDALLATGGRAVFEAAPDGLTLLVRGAGAAFFVGGGGHGPHGGRTKSPAGLRRRPVSLPAKIFMVRWNFLNSFVYFHCSSWCVIIVNMSHTCLSDMGGC